MEEKVVPAEDCLEQLRERVRQLETALETRLDIELAKGFLMGSTGVSADEAYLALRQHARSRRRDLHAVCRDVAAGNVDAQEVTRALRPL